MAVPLASRDATRPATAGAQRVAGHGTWPRRRLAAQPRWAAISWWATWSPRCRPGSPGVCRASIRRLRPAVRRRARAAAGRALRRPGPRSRHPPQRFRADAVRTRWRRVCGGGPMLREYIVSEAMHALGVPTTRSLAVVGTGRPVHRETPLPGAVLVRVASSHLRVGSFQYAALTATSPCCGASPTMRSPATIPARRRPNSRTSRCSKRWSPSRPH